MIVTLTLNPSLDRTFEIPRLVVGELNRVRHVTTEPAGKGINVSLALLQNGADTHAVLPVGGHDGVELVARLEATGLSHSAIPVSGRVRSNVSVVEEDGTVTKLNEPGPILARDELDDLATHVLDACRGGDWLVVSGNLTPGAPADFYAGLIERARSRSVAVALDTSGPPLRQAMESCPPALVKPNLDELSELMRGQLGTLGAVVDAAEVLVSSGAEVVLVSLGGEGAVVVTAESAVHGEVAVDRVGNTVGAGDTLLAGFLARHSTGAGVADSLALGLAWARAAVTSSETRMRRLSPEDLEAVSIHPIVDRDRMLAGTGP